MIDLNTLREKYSSRPNVNTGPNQGASLDIQRYLEEHGVQIKEIRPNGNSTFYILKECVFDPNHQGKDAMIVQANNGALRYSCFHYSCSGKTWHDARQIISGNEKLTQYMDRPAHERNPNTPNGSGQEAQDEPEQKDIKSIILPARSFLNIQTEKRELYLHPWLKEASIILISGARGCGKSWFALSTLVAVSNGTELGPWESYKSVPCLYLDGEMAIQDVQERLNGICPELDENFYIYSDAFAFQQGLPRADLTNEKWRDQMKQTLLDLGIKLWAIDNISSLTSGLDENSKKDWDPINQWLISLRFAGISTELVHHMGKPGMNKNATPRGTSGREDNADISIELIKPPDYSSTDGCRFISQFTKARIEQNLLPLIADTEFRLIQDEGKYTWEFGNVKQEQKIECLRLLSAKTEQKTIASELGITKGTVSKWKKGLIVKGYLEEDGITLTDKGKRSLGQGIEYDE